MKKRILSLIIAVLIIIPCFVIGVSADKYDPIDLSEAVLMSSDYKKLTYNQNTYVRFDSSMVNWEYSLGSHDAASNLDEVKSIDYELSTNTTIITADIYFQDGSSLRASYINENYYDEYSLLKDNATTYSVDFLFPSDNQVTVSSEKFFGKKTTIIGNSLWITDHFEVNAYSNDNSFYIFKGSLLLVDDQYYYVDFSENNITDPRYFYPSDYGSMIAYEINDAEFIEKLKYAYSEYNSDAIGFLVSDFSENVSIVLLCIVFVLIPLVSLILFLILSLRAKNPTYKKLFRAIYITSAIEIAIFSIAAILLIIFKQ